MVGGTENLVLRVTIFAIRDLATTILTIMTDVRITVAGIGEDSTEDRSEEEDGSRNARLG